MKDVSVLRIEGEIDAQNSLELEKALEDARRDPVPLVVVDLEKVGYVASAGWGVLLAGSRGVERDGKQLVVTGMSRELRRVFDMLHFHTVLRSAGDLSSALRLTGAP